MAYSKGESVQVGGKHEPLEFSKETSIAPVISILRGISYDKVKGSFPKGSFDSNAGISVVHLSEEGTVPSLDVTIGETPFTYHFHVAIVPPGKWVNSHYHKHGPEPYRFMSPGTGGEMNRGHVIKGKDDNDERVEWHARDRVAQGDEVEITEGEVHSFRNTNETEPCYFLFACPHEHLVDYDAKIEPADDSKRNRNGDRYIVEGLPGGDRSGEIKDRRKSLVSFN